jgi:hypothetical protein
MLQLLKNIMTQLGSTLCTFSQVTCLHFYGEEGQEMNLSTYKLHALGDYGSNIELFEISDSYSTQTIRVHFLPN